MKKQRILFGAVATILLLGTAWVGRAIDFDRGPDASEFLKKARSRARFSHMEKSRKIASLPALQSRVSAAAGLQKGFVHGPWVPLITGSQPYKDAEILRADPGYANLPGQALATLDRDWTTINSIRSDLLLDAAALEDRDQALYQRLVDLNDRREKLVKRQDQLNLDIDDWNRDCANVENPPADCGSRRDELVVRKTALDADIVDFNRDGAQWDQDSSELATLGDSLVRKIREWEHEINILVNLIRATLANPPDKDKQTCFWTGRRVPPENGVCVYDCNVSGETFIPAAEGDTPCPQWRIDVPIPPVGASSSIR